MSQICEARKCGRYWSCEPVESQSPANMTTQPAKSTENSPLRTHETDQVLLLSNGIIIEDVVNTKSRTQWTSKFLTGIIRPRPYVSVSQI